MLFKGGTALRIVYSSPRFSEDLDFTVLGPRRLDVRGMLEDVFSDMEAEGFDIKTDNQTTSGGWLALAQTRVHDWPIRIELNLSARHGKPTPQHHTIISPYAPAYTLTALSESQRVGEKIQALLSRKKPRDYYDLYFILRSGLDKKPVIEQKTGLLKALDEIRDDRLRSELKSFLPPTHWPTIKNLKTSLKKELTRL